MFKSKQHSYTDFFEGMLIGGSLGVMTTLILGTEKGKKLQKELLHKYKRWEHKAEHLYQGLQKTANKPAVKKFKKIAKKMSSQTTQKVAKRKSKAHSRKQR